MRVAISGAGVGGPTLAYWLHRFGHEAVIFEVAPALRRGGYLIDFWGLGYELAGRMGLLPELHACGYEMDRLSMVDDGGAEVSAMDVRPMREVLDGRLVSVGRTELAGAIFRAGQALGVRARFGVSISALEPVDGAVQVTLSDGSCERFDLVVGADGLHSRVRELTFGPEARFEVPLGCHVAALRLRGYPRRDELTYVSHTEPGRHAARVALRDDETLVLFICRSALLEGAPDASPRAALRHAFAGMGWEVPELLARLDDADELYLDRVSQIQLPRWCAGRVALVGDAAACVSLLAGEGTGLAMTEAYVLAGELDRAGGDLPAAFAAYEGRLRDFVAAKQRSALRMRSFFVPRSRLGVGVRDLVVRLAGRPFFARRMLAGFLRDELELPDYAPRAPRRAAPEGAHARP